LFGEAANEEQIALIVDRYRFWTAIPELDGRYLRVVTLEDKVTVHNAFPDRRFRP
jgi:hypothetical protein